jgi:hypothetical protein
MLLIAYPWYTVECPQRFLNIIFNNKAFPLNKILRESTIGKSHFGMGPIGRTGTRTRAAL